MSDSTLTVSEFTRQIRSLLEPRFDRVEVQGELSNVNRSRNGHLYMTLKDPEAQLPAVMWRTRAQRLDRELQDGDEVILTGSLQIYPPQGRYQLIADSLRWAGEGQLQVAFERLKQKLLQEGLFDESHKRPLPRFPEVIAVITSSTGAAFHDIQSTLEQRWPLSRLLLVHASVQGDRAAGELVQALSYLRKRDDLDLLIIGRGGGSLEDLWPFNEEVVARALFRFPVPTISAVGHETDWGITDFVADHRAATPTQAALMAVPDQTEIRLQIDERTRQIQLRVQQRLERHRERVRYLGKAHALRALRTRLNQLRETTQRLHARTGEKLHQRLSRYRDRVRYLGEAHALRTLRMQIQQKRQHLNWQRDRLVRRSAECTPHRQQRLDQLQEQLYNRFNQSLQAAASRHESLHHRLERRNPNEPLDRGFVRVWQKGKWMVRPEEVNREEEMELEWKERRLRVRSNP